MTFAELSANLMAGIFTLLLVVLAPSGYFVVAYQYIVGNLDAQAEVSALSINVLIQANPAMWQFEQVRLSELLERRIQYADPEKRRLVASNGDVVAENGGVPAKPYITRRYPVYDVGVVVAQLEICRTYRQLLIHTGIVAFCSLLVGAAVFSLLRIIPRRAIQKAFSAVTMSEKRYRSLYTAMREGLLLFRLYRDEKGQAVSFALEDLNPAAEKLLGLSRESALRAAASDLLEGAIRDHFHRLVEVVESGESAIMELPLPQQSRYFTVSTFSPAADLCALLMEDITEQKNSELQIHQLAYYDILTGLPNRSLLLDRLNQSLARASREGNRVALLFLDLDRFKDINDTLGHACGDQLLIEVSRRLLAILRRSDSLARLGGDEFIIMLAYETEELNVAHLAQNMLDALAAPFNLSGREIFSSGSIGISIYPEDSQDVDGLLRSADLAMYAAKQEGRNGYYFFSEEMNRKAHERLELENDLRHALERDEFFLEYQPVVNAREERFVGLEALVRWQHPKWGRTMPDLFIPVAEAIRIIEPLGEWVLRTACRQLSVWLAAGVQPLRLAINVSSRQIEHEEFPDLVAAVLAETGVAATMVELEVTETILMEHAVATARILKRLKGMGVSIAIDDFGTGYSSLGYLKNFTLDRIKIDRAFIRDICSTDGDQAIVAAIIAMASRLKLQVVAEGVETAEQLSFLLSCGCEEIQGYYYSQPIAGEQLTALLKRPVVPAAGG